MTIHISVIIPCYNQGQYLAEAIDSVLAQHRADAEIIVVNDGSPDHTADVARAYGDRIVYIEQENRGFSGARNTGIRAARGDYVAFLDSDDVYLPGTLDTLAAYLDTHPDTALVCGEAILWDGIQELGLKSRRSGRPQHPANFRWETINFTPTPSTTMVRRAIFMEIGLFDEGLKRAAEDWLLGVRVARRYPMTFLPEPLLYYRLHGANATADPAIIDTSNRYAARVIVDSPEFAEYPAFFRARLLYYRAATAWRFESKPAVLAFLARAAVTDPHQLGYGWTVINKGLRRALSRRRQAATPRKSSNSVAP